MLLQTELFIGDVIELSPTKMSTLDDFDLEKCTVLEVDKYSKRIKVIFNNNNSDNETFFDSHSKIDWFHTEHVIDVERDYKILKITDNEDTVSHQPVSIATMAKVSKKFTRIINGYTISGVVNEWDNETFIFIGLPYKELIKHRGEIRRISFSKFRPEEANINGIMVKAWYGNNSIVEVEDIFKMP
jgi:hypothetical protein